MVICLSGENTYGLREELHKLTADFVRQYGDIGLEQVDGEVANFERLQESLQGVPFLAERKMVVLRTPSANKRFTEQAETLLAELPDTTDLIIVEPKVDKRSSYYKLLKKSTDLREFATPDEAGLARWLVEAAEAGGGKLSQSDARFLIERVGANQQLLARELEKLLLYQPLVTLATIELLTEPEPQSSIFDLLEAAFAGDTAHMLSLYRDQREQKVDTAQIIAMLTWQLRVLALIKTAGKRSAQDIASTAKLNPFVIRKSQAVAQKLTLARLKKLIADLLDIDVRSKRENIDVDEALMNYLIRIAE